MPRSNKTNAPEMPGNIKAVKPKKPATISKKILLKSNWIREKATRSAISTPKIKLIRYLVESDTIWSIMQFFIFTQGVRG